MDIKTAAIIAALSRYVQEKPEHFAGLCHWLTNKADETLAAGVDGYSFMCHAELIIPSVHRVLRGKSRVTNQGGPTAGRVKLAKSLLHALKRGKISYVERYNA